MEIISPAITVKAVGARQQACEGKILPMSHTEPNTVEDGRSWPSISTKGYAYVSHYLMARFDALRHLFFVYPPLGEEGTLHRVVSYC
jgi:hypothetical protein